MIPGSSRKRLKREACILYSSRVDAVIQFSLHVLLSATIHLLDNPLEEGSILPPARVVKMLSAAVQ